MVLDSQQLRSSLHQMPLQHIEQGTYMPKSPFGPPRLLSLYQLVDAPNLGVRVVDIVPDNPVMAHLLNAQELAFPGMDGTKASMRIMLPGYTPYHHQFNIRRGRGGSIPLTIEQAARAIASEIRRAFMEWSRPQCNAHGWMFGQGGIRLDQIFLVGITRVSLGSVQPILAIELPGQGTFPVTA